jgi:hypothetical protein
MKTMTKPADSTAADDNSDENTDEIFEDNTR